MATYRIQDGNEVQTLEEAKLRKKLRDNDFSGLELVRREDEFVRCRPTVCASSGTVACGTVLAFNVSCYVFHY